MAGGRRFNGAVGFRFRLPAVPGVASMLWPAAESGCPSRRRWLQLATSGVLAGLLPRPMVRATGRARTAKQCLIVYMEGGPSHIDLWDLKPEAPREIRGEFDAIQTSHADWRFSELLPGLSRHAHRLAAVRSVTHGIVDHNAGSYYALSGRFPVENGQLVVADGPGNFPPYGAVLAHVRPSAGTLPSFVHVAEKQWNNGADIPGQSAGWLGASYDPFVSGDPSLPGYQPPGLVPLAGNEADRLHRRAALQAHLESLDSHGQSASAARVDAFQQQALKLLGSDEVRSAFDLSREPAAVRERYGVDRGSRRDLEARKFGGLPHLGQSALLARRLLERGVPCVTLITGRRIDQAWDTHRDHFKLMRRALCPPFDRAITALLDDLVERGLWDQTLVVFLGEFGRTPKVGYVTSGAGASQDGRDHWPYCYSVLFGGAGVQAGALYGASDRQGGYPLRDPCRPEDIAATVYAALGIPTDLELHDRTGRPHPLCTGRAITDILA
jgi:hypothetical protein